MEHGFYHPSRGYWQTTNQPSQEVMDTYPDGTVEVPLKPGPGYEWGGTEWAADPDYPAKQLEEERMRMVANAAQIQIALHDAARLDEVEAIVAASSRETQIWWSKGERIRRLSPVLADASTLMDPQPTPEWWDDLFRAAMELDV